MNFVNHSLKRPALSGNLNTKDKLAKFRLLCAHNGPKNNRKPLPFCSVILTLPSLTTRCAGMPPSEAYSGTLYCGAQPVILNAKIAISVLACERPLCFIPRMACLLLSIKTCFCVPRLARRTQLPIGKSCSNVRSGPLQISLRKDTAPYLKR